MRNGKVASHYTKANILDTSSTKVNETNMHMPW